MAERCVVTGGAGTIGSHIADGLVRTGLYDDIVILDDFTRGRRDNLVWAMANGPVRVVEGDIRDRGCLERAFQGADAVFHQAALRITQCAAEPRLAFEVLVVGTFNVLEAAVHAGVKKVVAASSASIYGLAETFPTVEGHHPYNNRTLYGAAKAFDEHLLRSFHEMYGLNYVALRYFNVYGPRMDSYGAYTEVFIRWIERIAQGQPPVIFGDGTQTMDFVYVEDVARANLLALESAATDTTFNVATGVETSLLDLTMVLLRVMGSNLQPEHRPERTVNPVPRRLADTRRAARELGFRAEIDLEEGLRRLVDWWRATRVTAA